MPEDEKFFRLCIKPGKPLIGPGPDISRVIYVNGIHAVSRQAFRILRVVAIVPRSIVVTVDDG
jgi:hypothetical protein